MCNGKSDCNSDQGPIHTVSIGLVPCPHSVRGNGLGTLTPITASASSVIT